MENKINPIDYDQTSRDVAKKLVDGLINADLPSDVREEIREWFKSEASENEKYDALEEIFSGLEPDTQYDRNVERCLAEQHKILGFHYGDKPQPFKEQMDRRSFSRSIMFRVAAVVFPLFILGGALVLKNMNTPVADKPIIAKMKTVVGEEGIDNKVTLPDNTIITLVDGAILTYSDDFAQRREVYIEGEAYFSVTHNPEMPFTVRSNSITITVHGTEFHVKAYADMPTAEVKLTAGSIAVTAEGIEETLMEPGQHFVYDRSHCSITLEAIGEGELLRLMKRSLQLDGQSLDEAFSMMSQYFGTPFRVDPGIDLDERIAVSFEDDVKLEEALSLLQIISKTRFDYKIEADTVTLTRRR